MSEQSRKLKNPLLTAAGQGFPFEGYASSGLLMPVTPATPAILPDESPEESSVGQEPAAGVLPQPPTAAEIGVTSVQDLGNAADRIHREQSHPPPPSQPQRQGYFTSILSSLPNLSLSTITGDVPSAARTPSHQQQPIAPPNPGGNREQSSTYGFAPNPYGPPPTSSGPFVAADQPRGPSGQYPPAFGEIGQSVPPTSSPSPRPPPTASTLPPSGGPGSYRLGNQRRLKYAPPPDLTSSTPKQYPAPPASSFLPTTQQQQQQQQQQQYRSSAPTAADFLIPGATFQPSSSSGSYAPPGSASSPNLYSGQIGGVPSSQTLSASFSTPSFPEAQQLPSQSPLTTNAPSFSQSRQLTGQYNPVISGWSGPTDKLASAPQEIPSRFPETATPQNTPANATFAGFASTYGAAAAAAPPTSLISSDGRGDARVSAGFTSSPGATKFSEGLTFDLPSSAFAGSNVGPISGAIIEPNVSSSREDTPAASATVEDKSFTPISAAKVTAKLEHLLAEREEDSSPVKSAIESTASVEETKSSEPLKQQQQQQSIVASSDPNQQTAQSETSEDLADVDLNANDSFPSDPPQDSFAAQISSGIEFAPALGSEIFARSGSHLSTPAETNVSSKSSSIAESFAQNQPTDPVASATSFFSGSNHGRKSELNYFPTEAPSALYGAQQSAAQSQQTPSSFFDSEPPKANQPYASSPFFVSNPQQIPPATTAQQIPTFYNPGAFPATSQDSSYSVFTPQVSANRPSVPNPFSTALGSSPPTFPTSEAFMATAMPEPTGSATLNPVQTSVNPGLGRSNSEMVPPSLQNLAAGPADRRMQYRPVYHHWFYRKEVESKVIWSPFSMQDSLNLEEVHNSSEITPETTVATDGGRYDVDILRRRRSPVYWTGNPTEVRRSSWFYKGSTESRYIPYEESTAARLEEEYKHACTNDNWNRRIELNNGEYIIFHSSTIQVHYAPATSPELAASWGNSAVSPDHVQTPSASSLLPIRPSVTLTNLVNPLRTAYDLLTQGSETGTYLQGAASRPKVVKRGVDEFNIDEGEPEKVDHLLFLVHGIGSVCDLKFRTVEEVVDEFRSISLQLVQSHYRTASLHGVVNRIEVLPISWHTTLHSEDTGIDKKLQAITLESIPKLRHFTNDTLLDILFYTSPIYCQTIMQTVGNEMNRLYSLFKERNSNFSGSVYLGGHSLGSLIVFDLLCHQKPPAEESRDETDPTLLNPDSKSDEDTVSSIRTTVPPVLKRRLSKKVSYVMGAAGTGQPFINYPQLSFHPQAFFALGSPIGMFVTVRGIDTLGDDFVLPTCPAFFNVFHPFDPVAYRVESLINPEAHKYRPMLIPHHKGRKRMHLELKETMARVGADLKQKLLDSVRSTWNSVYQLAMFHRPDNASLEQEIEKVVEEQLHKSPSVHEQQNDDDGGADFRVGRLNGGRRIDYVLQEAPFEYINEYIFALTSHVCYWESEDTMLMMLKEIYGTNGIQADAQLPPQTMTIERASPSPPIPSMSGASTSRPSETSSPVGMDPTSPIASSKPVGPPPMSGFVRKS